MLRPVHDVVVEQGEGVQHLDRCGDVENAGFVGGAGRSVAPVNERRAEALAAGRDQRGDLGGNVGEAGVDGDEFGGPLRDVAVEEGPFTVFAPTDEAFAALPPGTLDTLLADPTGDLAGILTYHVVEGEVKAADVASMDGQEVTTVNGATFTVNVGDDGDVTLTDAAGNEVDVVQTDVDASNGVIHVINAVLLPG